MTRPVPAPLPVPDRARDSARGPDSTRFAELLRTKRRFLIRATLFFTAYYFALPILCGYAPNLMSRKVLGSVSLAYLFALSQFVMAWALAAIYVRKARSLDELMRR